MSNNAAPSFFDRFGGHPLLIAHRGYRACYPENTLCAFVESLGRCGMIELDVQLSADRIAVVFHDDALTRTTNASAMAAELGMTGLILRDWPFAALRRLDVGSWYLQADPFGSLRGGIVTYDQLLACMPQRIPTLHEVLTWATANNLPLNVEIKATGRSEEQLIASVVVDEIRKASAVPLVLVSSFNHNILRICKQLAPDIALAALQEGGHPPDLVPYLQSLGVCAYHPEDTLVEAALVSALRSSGLHVNVFTVNNPIRQQQLFDLGVTGIFTDFPRTLS